jgi:VCBS repeat-containing protein
MRRTGWIVLIAACTGTVTPGDTGTPDDTGDDTAPPAIVGDDEADATEVDGISIDVLGNDPGEGAVIIRYDASGAMGLLWVQPDLRFAWRPDGAFDFVSVDEVVDDVFTYTARAADGREGTATVTVHVHGANTPPTVLGEVAATNEDTPLVIRILDNDVDPDAGDELTVTALDTTDTVGATTLNENQTVSYDPTIAFDHLETAEIVEDGFAYTVSDGHGGEGTAEVRITVVGRPD